MFFKVYKPAAVLAPYVKCYWILENNSDAGAAETILPDGSPELIFHFGDQYRSNINGKEFLQPSNLVVGQITRSISLQPTGSTGIFATRFYPWGLYPFVQTPVSIFTDGFADINDVIPISSHGGIADAIANATHDDKVKIVDTHLVNILSVLPAKKRRLVQRLVPALQHVYSSREMKVEEMARDANLGIRQFNRITKDITGLPPKALARIIRFNRFMELHQSSAAQYNLTQLLHHSGYYDQSHFIRDFKDITGDTPGSFFNKPNELADLLLF